MVMHGHFGHLCFGRRAVAKSANCDCRSNDTYADQDQQLLHFCTSGRRPCWTQAGRQPVCLNTQTAPSPTAMAIGFPPIFALVTSPSSESIRETLPSSAFATHTKRLPGTAVTAVGSWPTRNL